MTCHACRQETCIYHKRKKNKQKKQQNINNEAIHDKYMYIVHTYISLICTLQYITTSTMYVHVVV